MPWHTYDQEAEYVNIDVYMLIILISLNILLLEHQWKQEH